MKKTLLMLAAVAALMLTSACGSPSGSSAGGAPGTSTPGAASEEPVSPIVDAPTDAPQEACTPVVGGIPTNVEGFKCLNLVSTSGSDATGELAWLGTDPFTLVTSEQDGSIHFSSKTPCNTVMSPAEVTDTQFIVGPNMAMTMMACMEPQSNYERWVVSFFSSPLDYTLNAGSLVLRNDHGTVTFKPATS